MQASRENYAKTYTLSKSVVLQVNQYPGHRDFKAIGSGGDDFKQTIVRAVEDIVGPVNQDRVMERPSSQGKFISVTLRDVKVQNPDQVTPKMHHLMTSQLSVVVSIGIVSPCQSALLYIAVSLPRYLQVLAVYAAMRKDKRLRYYL